jgi:hypothetical protein
MLFEIRGKESSCECQVSSWVWCTKYKNIVELHDIVFVVLIELRSSLTVFEEIRHCLILTWRCCSSCPRISVTATQYSPQYFTSYYMHMYSVVLVLSTFWSFNWNSRPPLSAFYILDEVMIFSPSTDCAMTSTLSESMFKCRELSSPITVNRRVTSGHWNWHCLLNYYWITGNEQNDGFWNSNLKKSVWRFRSHHCPHINSGRECIVIMICSINIFCVNNRHQQNNEA